MRRCEICQRATPRHGWCKLCQRSYDRDNALHGGDVIGAIRWAVTRAIRFERQRVRHDRVRAQARRMR